MLPSTEQGFDVKRKYPLITDHSREAIPRNIPAVATGTICLASTTKSSENNTIRHVERMIKSTIARVVLQSM